jgi:tetratricopeptide (TPR) repeat protein
MLVPEYAAPQALATDRSTNLAGYLLVTLLSVVAFVLACYEITDRDIWWQLRSGQWIVDHGRVPELDPFSYGAADREWIDLHWLFQIVLFGAYRIAGLPGVVLLAGACAATSVLLAFAVAAPNAPRLVCAACWLPALALMGWRLPPRPELFSLVFLAADLAILKVGRKRPWLLGCLPVVQLLWVNSHGLFILGPLVVGFDLLERTAALASRRRSAPAALANEPDAISSWRRAAAVLAFVAAACCVNPYAIRGALFPWELLPKIASEGNLYKKSVAEFTSPTRALREYRGGIVDGGWYLGQEYLLLAMLPVSFVLPAVRQAWRRSAATRKGKRRFKLQPPDDLSLAWRAVSGMFAIGLPAASALTLPGATASPWLLSAGNYLPLGFLLIGLAGGWTLRTSPSAEAMAVWGAVGCALWLVWLRLYFCGTNVAVSAAELVPQVGALALIVGAAAVWLALQNGGSVFRLLLAAAFAYLGLQAVRNATLFGLVAGVVLAGNFGDFFAGAAIERPASRIARRATFAGQVVLLIFLCFWLWAIVNDDGNARFHYYDWLRHSRKFGFHEKPLWSAHDAAKFAGQPGMPEHAVAFGFEQAGVYLFHNGPERKAYLDPRLEVPDVEVYRNYVQLSDALAENDPSWPERLARIGNPLVLVAHAENERREANLLAHPDWRCAYFDAVAAIFVRRGQATEFPAVDFAQRRMRAPQASVPNLPGAAYREATALCRLAAELRRFPQRTWTHRLPVLLAARERIEFALNEESGSARVWALLGNCFTVQIVHELGRAANDDWSTARDLPWAQAAYAYRRALNASPGDPEALAGLYQLFAARGMADVQLAVGVQLQKIGWASPEQSAELDLLRRSSGGTARSPRNDVRPDETQFVQRLRDGSALAALAVVEQSSAAARQWPIAKQAARLYLLMGIPERARQILESCSPPADETQLRWLLADAYAAEGRHDAASELYGEILAKRPELAEIGLALATLKAKTGELDAALAACRSAMAAAPREAVEADLQAWERLLSSSQTDFKSSSHLGLTFPGDNLLSPRPREPSHAIE